MELDAGNVITRYAMPISDLELEVIRSFIEKEFRSYNVEYTVTVEQDNESRRLDKKDWSYGLFAEVKTLVFHIANMDKATRDIHKTVFSPITKISFAISKEGAISSYEKLSLLPTEKHLYPEIVPYCDCVSWHIQTSTDGWYRLYRTRTHQKREGSYPFSNYRSFYYGLSIDDLKNGVSGTIRGLCLSKDLTFVQ